MTSTCWLQLLLLCVCYHHEVQPSKCNRPWTSPQFRCDVTATNNSEVIFNCRDRHLKKVPCGITSNATELDLSENRISNITADSFSHLVNITKLDLSWANHNKALHIHDDALKNLTKLKHLMLNGNHVRKIPNLPLGIQILELTISNIRMDDINLSGLTNITKLLLLKNCYSWNPCHRGITIRNGVFAHMNKLQYLDMAFNNLTHVPKGLPPSLYILKLSCNIIANIAEDDFTGLHNLKNLSLQGNCPRCQNAPYPCVPCKNGSLKIHPQAFQNLTELELLHLGGNSLDHLDPNWFQHLKRLKWLFLSFNFLASAIEGNATFLTNLRTLEKLDLSFNYGLKSYKDTINLSREFANLESLRILHLEGLVFKTIGESTLKPLYGLQNLTILNLGTNFIIHMDSGVFRNFPKAKLIYLSENRLYPISGKSLSLSDDSDDRFTTAPLMRPPKDFSFELNHLLVNPECYAAGRVLMLSSNNIFFINPEQFKAYEDIKCLNLSGNGFSAAPNGTEFTSLPNLTYLDLSKNKIDLAYDNAFKELQKLQVLDLSHNSHYFLAYGVSHNLNFLKNLPCLRVLNMSYNAIATLTTKQMCSNSLSELQFRGNRLGKLWNGDSKYKTLFTGLVNLTHLDISQNQIQKLPYYVFKNLPRNLTHLRISDNFLTEFNWDKLANFHQLQVLDLSKNSLSTLMGMNWSFTQTLTFLNLNDNKIIYLDDGLFKGPKSLSTLSLSYNKLTIINESTLHSGPNNPIQTLYLEGNPFQCTCDALDFILWIEKSKVKIPRLVTEVMCKSPENQKNRVLIDFDIYQCVNDSLAFRLWILTVSFIFVFMFVATAAHLFYWDVSYSILYMKAKLAGYRSLKCTDSSYDVFVTYDTSDPQVSEWVMRNLRVKLEDEGEKYLPLCLEERDWMPGVPLLDNLTHSIRCSRKTLFVLTDSYVKSGTFKLAMYLAHQRLLDENLDVIVLLILDPVLQHSRFLRLRRRLCGKSVLEWPRTPAAEPWFWQNLRTVIRMDNQFIYNKTYSKYLTSR